MKTFAVLVTLWLSGILAISRTRRQQLPLHRSDRQFRNGNHPGRNSFYDYHKGILAGRIEKKSKPEDYQTKYPSMRLNIT